MELRIQVKDILYALKNGECNSKIELSTRSNVYKGRICSFTPNSGNMRICLVIAVPFNEVSEGVKIITIMWENEPNDR